MGSSRSLVPPGVFLQELHEPSISRALAKASKPAESSEEQEKSKVTQSESSGQPPESPARPGNFNESTNDSNIMVVDSDWRTPFRVYLETGGLPEDKVEKDRLKRRVPSYVLIGNDLCRRSANGTLMRCIPVERGQALLQDIHSGICGNHAGARTMVGKAYRQGFYWPTAVSDAESIVRRCEGCQYFARQIHVPAGQLQTIPITWPFSTWGLDLVGPFKKAKGGFTHLFVAVDKFTKWIEAKPAASITAAKAVEFIKEITHRFGIPNTIITDNGTQFTAREFRDFCDNAGIQINYASVSHPQSNGQVERSNGMILQGLKPRIFDRLKPYAGKWLKETPSVLWALRTTPSRATGQTPFSLVYGSEAMLPTEIEHKSLRVQNYSEEQSNDSRVDDLIRLEELREAAVIQSAKHQQAMRRYHARNVNPRGFNVGDFVLRKIQTTKDRHKLSPVWEGPFEVVSVTRPGSYRLQREDGSEIPNSWNIDQLRPFFM